MWRRSLSWAVTRKSSTGAWPIPTVSGVRRPGTIDWYRAPTDGAGRLECAVLPLVPRRGAEHLLQRAGPAVRDGRGDQAALIYDSPVTGTQRTYTYTELLDEVARFAGVLRGLGVDKGDRVIIYMPMIPEALIAMLACARIGAVHSVVFGGFAAAELATRIDDAAPKVVVSASCGIEGSRIIEYKPILDRAIDLARAQAGALRDPAAAAGGRRTDRRARPGLEPGGGRGRARGLRPGRGDRPAVHPVHLRHHGQAQGRGPRQRRPRGRAALEHGRTSTTPSRARCSGPPPTWAGWSGTPTSSTPRCWPDARPCCTRASRWAPRTRARSGGSSPSTRSRRCSPRRPRSARSRRRTRRASCPASTTCPDSGTCSWPASGSTPRPTGGRASCSASRSSTTGGRPRPAGPSPPT